MIWFKVSILEQNMIIRTYPNKVQPLVDFVIGLQMQSSMQTVKQFRSLRT